MPFCTSCGSQMEGSFCTSCGARVEVAPGGGGHPVPSPVAQPAAAAPAKKTSPVVWVLVGCFGLIVIVGLVLTVGGFFVARKVKQVVDVDKGTITLPGKNGEKVQLKVKGEGESGSLEVKTAEGTARFGAGAAADIPKWIPTYPGSNPEGAISGQGKEGAGGMFGFKTADAVDKVAAYYEQELNSAGFKTTKNVINQNDKATTAIINAVNEANKREIHVTVSGDQDTTQVAIVFKGQ